MAGKTVVAKLLFISKSILSDNRTIFVVLLDTSLFTSVYFLHWEPLRYVGFYFLDVCLAFLSFIIYSIIAKEIYDTSKAFMGLIALAVTALLYFNLLLFFSKQVGFSDYTENPVLLFLPLNNFIVFLFLSVISHYYNVRKYLFIDKSISKTAFAIFLTVNFLFLPGLIFLTFIINLALPFKWALLIAFVFVRNFMEYVRMSSLIGNGWKFENNKSV